MPGINVSDGSLRQHWSEQQEVVGADDGDINSGVAEPRGNPRSREPSPSDNNLHIAKLP